MYYVKGAPNSTDATGTPYGTWAIYTQNEDGERMVCSFFGGMSFSAAATICQLLNSPKGALANTKLLSVSDARDYLEQAEKCFAPDDMEPLFYRPSPSKKEIQAEIERLALLDQMSRARYEEDLYESGFDGWLVSCAVTHQGINVTRRA